MVLKARFQAPFFDQENPADLYFLDVDSSMISSVSEIEEPITLYSHLLGEDIEFVVGDKLEFDDIECYSYADGCAPLDVYDFEWSHNLNYRLDNGTDVADLFINEVFDPNDFEDGVWYLCDEQVPPLEEMARVYAKYPVYCKILNK